MFIVECRGDFLQRNSVGRHLKNPSNNRRLPLIDRKNDTLVFGESYIVVSEDAPSGVPPPKQRAVQTAMGLLSQFLNI